MLSKRLKHQVHNFTFIVPGKPVGKARARYSPVNRRWYTPPSTADYEKEIATLAKAARPSCFDKCKPCELLITIRRKPPTRWKKSEKEDAIKKNMPVVSKPDIDNVIKIVMDALNGIAWEDDTQVYLVRANRFYDEKDEVGITVEHSKHYCL